MNRWDAAGILGHLSAHLRSADKGDCVLIPLVSRTTTETNDENRSIIADTLGRLAPSLGETLTARFVVAQLCALSEDPSPKVRRSTVLSIREVFKMEDTANRLIPVYQRLCTDPSAAVRNTCVDVFSSILPTIPDETVQDVLLGIYVSWATQDSSLAVRKNAVAQSASLLSTSLPPSVFDSLFTLYKEEQSDSGVSLVHAKFFAPIVARIGSPYWDKGLSDCFQRYSTSIDDGHRRELAASIPVVARYLDTQIMNSDKFFPHIISLMCDSVNGVSQAMISAVPDLYPALAAAHREHVWITISRQCEKSWRYRESVARMLGPFLHVILNSRSGTEGSIVPCPYTEVVPLWRKLIVDRAACVREHAVGSTSYLFSCMCEDWTDPPRSCIKLMSELKSLGKSPSSLERQIFIHTVAECMRSRAIPVEITETIFLRGLMHLAHDSAATVRTTWARQVAPLLRFPGGRWAHHRDLVILAHQLLLDMDKEVVRSVSRVSFSPLDELNGATPPPPPPQIEVEGIERIRRLLSELQIEQRMVSSESTTLKREDPLTIMGDVEMVSGS